MKRASLLRETMWSMISKIHSNLDFDYAAYTAENLRLRVRSRAWRRFLRIHVEPASPEDPDNRATSPDSDDLAT